MNVFVAGATGAIGRQLLPRLVEAGHTVVAMTRRPDRVPEIRAVGAHPVVLDVFDRDKLHRAVLDAKPEVVIHQLTSIPHRIDPRQIRRDMAPTNRLRTEGTRLLLQAAKAAGARRFIAQSIATYYTPGNSPATETDPLYRHAPAAFVEVVEAVHQLEDMVLNASGIEGIALRYGHLYGPGTMYSADGSFTGDVRRKRVPIIGNGGGVFSFIHVEDAADATIVVMERGNPGLYNIVDDDPAPLREWLPIYATLCGAPPPMRVSKLIGRLAAGRFGVFFMTEQRGASNQKARQDLGWSPRYRSWRDGFRVELASALGADAVQSGRILTGKV